MIYIYEGILSSGATMTQLGEEQFGQEGINFGFTLDGTKDSCKFEVLSFRRESVKPFSVVCHHETSSWWIIQKDKVERYTNEQGWIYKHSLQCIGAIELLNARDLTNCGFNQGKYTLQDFILRLFSLSNFEFRTPTLVTNGNIDLTQKVDYIKTFENYTLLSALREMLDGYNQCVKLNFTRNLTYNQITGCELVITPKTGDISLDVLDIDTDFNNTQELRNMDKNSYGTIVVSNVDNAVSSATKLYPNVGGAKISANEYDVTPENGIVRLPSNIFMLKKIEMCMPVKLVLDYYNTLTNEWVTWKYNDITPITNGYNVANGTKTLILEAKEWAIANTSGFDEDDFDSKTTEIETKLYNGATIEFKQGCVYNPSDNSWGYKDNSYTIKELHLWHNDVAYYYGQVVLDDEETASGTHNPWNVIKWKRGSDEISGFGWLSYDRYNNNSRPNNGGACFIPAKETINGQNECILYEWNGTISGISTDKLRIKIYYTEHNAWKNGTAQASENCLMLTQFAKSSVKNVPLFKIKYIPMTDLKVKLDNNEDNKHTHLYNQNGKLTDTLAFSKLINSYKTEIESENIVKYYTGCELFGLGTSTFRTIESPKLGQIVLDSDNEQYIINSVSYNLYQNEPNTYKENDTTYTQYLVECEYSLSKNVATKSLMVNPNTNIRDYGIPQKYNIRRTHIMRDFWELDHSDSPHLSTPHLTIDKILNIGYLPKTYNQHTAIMQIAYTHEINGSDKYYYQLESTTYILKKAIFEVVEFKDNNIIGYDVQNVYSGFDIQKLLVGFYNLHATPISYVDENGEFKGITIYMCNTEQMENIYYDYKEWLSYQDPSVTTDLPIQDMMIFIPYEIFNIAGAYKDYQMIYYDETDDIDNYYKDALEVPVFEYAYQIDDTNDVIIGENILENSEQDFVYLYSYTLTTKGVANNNNWSALDIPSVSFEFLINDYIAKVENGVAMEYNQNKLDIKLYTYNYFNITDNDNHNVGQIDFDELEIENYDLVIVRHTIQKVEHALETTEKTINTSKIIGSQFAYDYEESKYIAQVYVDLNDIDIGDEYVDTSTMQVISSRISSYSGSFPAGSYCSVMYESSNRRFSIIVYCNSMPSSSDFCYVEFVFSYESRFTFQNTRNDLMFVIRHTENANIEDDTLSLSLNSYRLD